MEHNWDKLGLPKSTGDKRLAPLVTPDERPSSSRLEYREVGRRISLMLEVKSDDGKVLGALMLSDNFPASRYMQEQAGLAAYSREEIHGVY